MKTSNELIEQWQALMEEDQELESLFEVQSNRGSVKQSGEAALQQLLKARRCLETCLADQGVNNNMQHAAQILSVFNLTTKLCFKALGQNQELDFHGAEASESPTSETSAAAVFDHELSLSAKQNSEQQHAPEDVRHILGLGANCSMEKAHNQTSAMYGTSRLSCMESTLAELYDRLGGWELLSAAVQHMYSRLFEDDRTRSFFEDKDHGVLMSHMTCFMASALSGKLVYSPERIYALHRQQIENQGLRGIHVDIMVQHLDHVLHDLGAPEELIHDAKTCLLSARKLFEPRARSSTGTPARLDSGISNTTAPDSPGASKSGSYSDHSAVGKPPAAAAHSTTSYARSGVTTQGATKSDSNALLGAKICLVLFVRDVVPLLIEHIIFQKCAAKLPATINSTISDVQQAVSDITPGLCLQSSHQSQSRGSDGFSSYSCVRRILAVCRADALVCTDRSCMYGWDVNKDLKE